MPKEIVVAALGHPMAVGVRESKYNPLMIASPTRMALLSGTDQQMTHFVSLQPGEIISVQINAAGILELRKNVPWKGKFKDYAVDVRNNIFMRASTAYAGEFSGLSRDIRDIPLVFNAHTKGLRDTRLPNRKTMDALAKMLTDPENTEYRLLVMGRGDSLTVGMEFLEILRFYYPSITGRFESASKTILQEDIDKNTIVLFLSHSGCVYNPDNVPVLQEIARRRKLFIIASGWNTELVELVQSLHKGADLMDRVILTFPSPLSPWRPFGVASITVVAMHDALTMLLTKILRAANKVSSDQGLSSKEAESLSKYRNEFLSKMEEIIGFDRWGKPVSSTAHEFYKKVGKKWAWYKLEITFSNVVGLWAMAIDRWTGFPLTVLAATMAGANQGFHYHLIEWFVIYHIVSFICTRVVRAYKGVPVKKPVEERILVIRGLSWEHSILETFIHRIVDMYHLDVSVDTKDDIVMPSAKAARFDDSNRMSVLFVSSRHLLNLDKVKPVELKDKLSYPERLQPFLESRYRALKRLVKAYVSLESMAEADKRSPWKEGKIRSQWFYKSINFISELMHFIGILVNMRHERASYLDYHRAMNLLYSGHRPEITEELVVNIITALESTHYLLARERRVMKWLRAGQHYVHPRDTKYDYMRAVYLLPEAIKMNRIHGSRRAPGFIVRSVNGDIKIVADPDGNYGQYRLL